MGQEYIIEEENDGNNIEKQKFIDEIRKEEENDKPMGDVYDVYSKAVGVNSRISGMTEDYTLTNYDIDIYNLKMPKFIREQRKLLRIIESFIVVPKRELAKHFNTKEKVNEMYKGLQSEYKMIEGLLLGELDECVIMARTPNGEVIGAFLEHGLQRQNEMMDSEIETPEQRAKEGRRQ